MNCHGLLAGYSRAPPEACSVQGVTSNVNKGDVIRTHTPGYGLAAPIISGALPALQTAVNGAHTQSTFRECAMGIGAFALLWLALVRISGAPALHSCARKTKLEPGTGL